MMNVPICMARTRVQVAIAIAILAWTSTSAYSQTVGSEVENQNRGLSGPGVRSHTIPDSLKVMPEKAERALPQADGDKNIPITRFKINGLTAYPVDEILAQVGTQMSLAAGNYSLDQINELAAEIQKILRGRGLIGARAVVPVQELHGGVLVIQVVEAKLDAFGFKVTAPTGGDGFLPSHNVDVHRIETVVRSQLCRDSDAKNCDAPVLQQGDVERALLLAGEMTNSLVTGDLDASTSPGLRLDVNSTPVSRVSGEAGLDNFGLRSVGVNRGQVRTVIRDLMSAGDSLGIYGLTTSSTNVTNFQVDYSMYVGSLGWKAGVAVSRTKYQLAGDFEDLNVFGDAKTVSAYATYPLIRKLDSTADFRVEFERAQLTDEMLGMRTERIQSGIRIGASGAFSDNSIAYLKANTSWNLALAAASVDTRQLPEGFSAVDSSSVKLIGGVNRIQALGAGFLVSANIYGQVSNANLSGYGKLFLGGPGAVRAYASGEAGGDSALIGQFQFGWAGPLPGLELPDWAYGVAFFYDRGWAKLEQHPAEGVMGNTAVRAGTGIEVSLLKKDRLNVRLFYARIAGTPVSEADGKNGRIGVTAGIAF